MAHAQQLKFIQLVRKYFLKSESGQSAQKFRILEIGSYDVNGSIREFLQNERTEYIGVDLCEGKGVDLVGYGHELELPSDSFDLTISCECFEHDPNWAATFTNMCRMTKSGGFVVFTCATVGRVEHGTTRSNAEHSPGTQFIGLDYYKNLTKDDFYDALEIDSIFSDHYFFFEKSSYDLYFIGCKKEGSFSNVKIREFLSDVKEIKKTGKFRFKIIEVPVYFARIILPETSFQNFSCAYLQRVHPLRRFIKSLSQNLRN